MEVEIGFSTRTGIPALINWRERGTWVLFGVQTMAASGRGLLDSRSVIEGKYLVLREDASETACGEGSVMESRLV